jgi:hypothetical protein
VGLAWSSYTPPSLFVQKGYEAYQAPEHGAERNYNHDMMMMLIWKSIKSILCAGKLKLMLGRG